MAKFYELSDINLEKITPQQLGELLVEAKKTYYTTSNPIMSDHTYDQLEETLKKLNPHHRIFKKVGHKNFDTGFPKQSHIIPMGSQAKVKTKEELVKYFTRHSLPQNTSYIIQPKCDGTSLEVIYKNGQAQSAITRGDGKTGDLVTQNASQMKGFKQALKTPFTGSIRFETMITFKDFESLKKVAKEENYTNPRNSVSGITQRLDGKHASFCTLFCIDIDHKGKRKDIPTEIERFDLAKTFGFKVVKTILCKNFDEIEKQFQSFSKKRNSYPFEIDGLVVKINDIKLQKSLGSINQRPKGQVAYKFPNESKESTIKKVTWQIGPLGTVTPVAQIDPVQIGGSTVTYASLANFDLIKEKNINLSDIVSISRRGDVIPYIEKVIVKVKKGHLSAPTSCPSCKSPLKKVHKYLKCQNPDCKGQTLGRLDLFCKKLDIDGISIKTLKKLSDAKKIKLPGDFYSLKISDFLDLEGLGEKSGQNILKEVQKKRSLTPQELLFSVSIPYLSLARLKQLKKEGYDSVKSILSLKESDLNSLHGFKETLSKKIIIGIKSREKEIRSLTKAVTIKSKKTNNDLNNLSFCITGKLERSRKEIQKDLESRGGKVLSAVSKNLDYLVTNDPNSSSSKNKEAKKLKIKIISEKDLEKLLQKPL